MRNLLFGLAFIVLGIFIAYQAGAFNRFLYNSKVEQRNDIYWKVYLVKSDGWFNTGLSAKAPYGFFVRTKQPVRLP